MEVNKNQEVVEETVEETVEAEAQAEEVTDAEHAETENAEAVNAEATDAEQIEETVEEAAEPTKEKSKLFKKKKDQKDEKIEELSDKLLRQMAEFDNFRKRTEKEKSAMYEIGAKDVVEKLLPVVDNFERGFQSVAEEDKEDAELQKKISLISDYLCDLSISLEPTSTIEKILETIRKNG